MADKPLGCVYRIVNKVTGQFYIGQTTQSLEKRFSNHCFDPNDSILKQEIKRYGRKEFFIETLKECHDIEELSAWELFYIQRGRQESKDLIYNAYLAAPTQGFKSPSILNKKSMARLVRVPIHLDNWLQERVHKIVIENPGNRTGIATEITKILAEAYEKDKSKA